MMRRERAVDRAVQHDMLAGQSGDEFCQYLTRRAVAVVPNHLQHAVAAVPVGKQARDVVGGDVDAARRHRGFRHDVAGRRLLAQCTDLLAVERLAAEDDLEAVVVGRIVAAGDHHGTVSRQPGVGVIQHRRRAAADAQRLDPGGTQAVRQGRLERGARQPAVIADGDRAAAGARHQRAETASDGECVGVRQRAAHRAADVILAQRGRVEPM